MSHLTAGDFNLHSWGGGDDTRYHERVAESGIWELSDPRLATYERGGTRLWTIGFGFPGGGCAYWFFSPDAVYGGEGESDNMEGLYTGSAFPVTCVTDHGSVILAIRRDEDPPKQARRPLRIKNLTEEGWARRGGLAQEHQ